jgi:hypothetical protein
VDQVSGGNMFPDPPEPPQSLKMNYLLAGGEMANLLQKRVLFLGTIQKAD